jgi:glycosyltransferase involved in cell wall biosynthesis
MTMQSQSFQIAAQSTMNLAVQSAQKSLVSVVIPTRNRTAKTLRAVRSALAQTHKDLEVIVVDDGSEDPHELRKALAAVGDSRIRIELLDRNRGGGFARNAGVRLSIGNFIAFLDSDDQWLPEKIEAQLAVLTNAGPNAVCYCRYLALTSNVVPEDPDHRPQRAIRQGESVADYLFCNRGSIVTPAIMVPREVALRVPFNEALVRHQDFGYLIDLSRANCNFVMCEGSLVVVDWLDLEASKRQLNLSASLNFLRLYGPRMSAMARGGFWIKQVVHPAAFSRAIGIKAFRFPMDVLTFLALRPRELLKTVLFKLPLPPHHLMRLAHFLTATKNRMVARQQSSGSLWRSRRES